MHTWQLINGSWIVSKTPQWFLSNHAQPQIPTQLTGDWNDLIPPSMCLTNREVSSPWAIARSNRRTTKDPRGNGDITQYNLAKDSTRVIFLVSAEGGRGGRKT